MRGASFINKDFFAEFASLRGVTKTISFSACPPYLQVNEKDTSSHAHAFLVGSRDRLDN